MSHRNILFDVRAGLQTVAVRGDDLMLSFLPLSHMLERSIGYYLPLVDRGELAFQADYAWQDDHFLQIENDPYSRHDSYGIANAKVSWHSPDGRYSVSAFVNNLTDEEYFTYQNTLGADWGYGVWGRPRTSGMRFEVSL